MALCALIAPCGISNFSGIPQRILQGGDKIGLGARELTVLRTQGRSLGRCCVYEPEREYLFSGDLIYGECLDVFYPTSLTFCRNTIPSKAPVGLEPVDRKLRAKIREKKIAMGHKPDDHEEHQQMGWGGMSM